MVGTPEAGDCIKRMDTHAMIGEKRSSWAVTCKKLLEDDIRVHGIKSDKNNTANKKQNKRWKNNISSSRYRGCIYDRNEEESCGSR